MNSYDFDAREFHQPWLERLASFSRRRWFPFPPTNTFGSVALTPARTSVRHNTTLSMVTLRVIRHDRPDTVLADCQSTVIPARGEAIQLDTLDATGEMTRPSTMWRIVAVTVHIPSTNSSAPADGSPLAVKQVEVLVLPDVSLIPEFAAAAQQVLSESRM